MMIMTEHRKNKGSKHTLLIYKKHNIQATHINKIFYLMSNAQSTM